MKLQNLLLLTLITIVSPTSLAKDLTFDTTKLSGLDLNVDRILLVGFKDQHMLRIHGSTTPSSYRRRGDYKNSTWSQRLTANIEAEYNLQKLTEWPMTEVGIHCAVYLVPSELSLEQTIAKLEQDERVDIVQRLHQFKTLTHKYNDPYYKLQSNMHDMHIDQAHNITTGRDVSIAMIDTGVDFNHPDLKGQIKTRENFASGFSSSFSKDKHGTAIAGILVARTDNKTGIIGVAPNAHLIALKACWPDQADSLDATCNSFALALAVNTAIKLGADIVNMSLTGPQDPLLELLLNKAMEKGIIVVAADPGNSKDMQRFPASLKNVISVQTLQKPESNKLTDKTSLYAPGENILTTLPRGTYGFISGSSLSAAHVSGIIALLLELKPDLTIDESRRILQKSFITASDTTKKGLKTGINAKIAILEICAKLTCPIKL